MGGVEACTETICVVLSDPTKSVGNISYKRTSVLLFPAWPNKIMLSEDSRGSSVQVH